MISKSKAAQAFHAFNGVLVQLRFWAYTKEDHKKIATVLDITEQLPRFLSSAEDQTDDFEAALREMAERFPEFGLGLQRFLREEEPGSW
ncbi:MAG: hypothetical protein GY722_04945 [bacterium]|nr:hypothetical protein [bacterium]